MYLALFVDNFMVYIQEIYICILQLFSGVFYLVFRKLVITVLIYILFAFFQTKTGFKVINLF